MRNLKLEIEYDGRNYCGWQVQNSPRSTVNSHQKKSIQEVIEKALRKILQEKVKLVASGRTDAGVHALGQVANFKSSSDIPAGKLQKALNAVLPDDIVITKAEEAGRDFHSRFSAKSKVYRYTILNRPYPSALLKNRVYFYPYPLDVKLMRREARLLLGKHDFKAFQASANIEAASLKTIKKIKVIQDSDLIYIDIEADGFLYNMARNIVGTLIEIGRGKFPQGSMKHIIRSKNRKFAGPTAPGCGLCLLEVKYK
jgi:tRNA pseudouridine38-40 synthase